MQTQEVLEYLKRFSYLRPGCCLDFVLSADSDSIILRASKITVDADNPGQEIGVHLKSEISVENLAGSPTGWPFLLKETIVSLVHDLEIHECNEWLRFDGVKINDPHR